MVPGHFQAFGVKETREEPLILFAAAVNSCHCHAERYVGKVGGSHELLAGAVYCAQLQFLNEFAAFTGEIELGIPGAFRGYRSADHCWCSDDRLSFDPEEPF